MTKTCRGPCGQTKPETSFEAVRNGKRRNVCHTCRGVARRPPVKPDPVRTAVAARTEERERRDLKREHSALVDELQRKEAAIAELVKMQRAPTVIVYKQAKWDRADAVPCAAASDWHVEEEVKKAAVHGLNEYNLEIARERSEFFFRNFLRLADIQARDSKVRSIYLAALGDFFSGWIHQELMASTLLAPGDAARFWKGLFISGIDFLLKESSYVIEADFIPGNHGRMTQQMHFSDPTGTSLETFAYHAVAGKYEGNPRVRFNVASQAMVYRRFFEKMNVRLIHGYEVKYGGGVGGITIPVNKALAQWDQAVHADLTLFGHFHQLIDGRRFLGNGSVIGYNTYAQAIKAGFEEPVQAFFLIDARNGGQKTVTAPIFLSKAAA